jgi:RNase P subunit RPR2
MRDDTKKKLKEYLDKNIPEYAKSMECSECKESVLYWGTWITKIEDNKVSLICQNCFTKE